MQAAPVETAAQKQAREAAHVKYLADMKIKQEAEAAAKLAAKGRAKKLLMDTLSKGQRETIEKFGYFDVAVGGKTYRIRQGTHGNVRLLDGTGKEVQKFCVQPDAVPDEDAMLAQKLWLEADEAEFLKVANMTRLT